jgi:hypothetical protein
MQLASGSQLPASSRQQHQFQSNEYINLFVALGQDHARYQVGYFTELERLKDRESDLKETYDRICQMLDGALNYLRTKKGRLSAGQMYAKALLLEMRKGCEICGLFEGRHSQACIALRKG